MIELKEKLNCLNRAYQDFHLSIYIIQMCQLQPRHFLHPQICNTNAYNQKPIDQQQDQHLLIMQTLLKTITPIHEN